MSSKSHSELRQRAIDCLQTNDLGGWTRPTPGLYPHQWLWDSCFIAIGLRHIDTHRAQQELRSLLKGQWRNGMLPHIIFSDNKEYHAGPELWQSRRHPDAPTQTQTTAMTQPPVLAEAVWRVAEKLPATERHAWLSEMFEPLVRYHTWLYRERDPHNEGAVFLIHPWESGLDNSPPWMRVIRPYQPWSVRITDMLGLGNVLDQLRKDTKQVPGKERIRTKELFTVYHLLSQLRHHDFDIEAIINRSSVPLVIDVVFNSLLVRANRILQQIADELEQTIPVELAASIGKAGAALQTFRGNDGVFWHRDFRSRQLIDEPSIAGLMPLYSGALQAQQVDELVEQLHDPQTFWLQHPVPSTPRNSPYFVPRRYWQGPTWVNMNWLLIDGLRRHGHNVLANELRSKTLNTIAIGGMHEYFSPLNGKGAGASPFSWTAALTLDLLEQQ